MISDWLWVVIAFMVIVWLSRYVDEERDER